MKCHIEVHLRRLYTRHLYKRIPLTLSKGNVIDPIEHPNNLYIVNKGYIDPLESRDPFSIVREPL